jgi:hypothetical protein
MKAKAILLMLLLAAAMLGCGRQQQSRHVVILPDVSGSIARESLEQAFKAIDELVGHLQRGDKIAIIPILGDAHAEASGRITRFEVPKERRAYDADLRDFRRKLAASLAEMQASAADHPGQKTDILGSIALAQQEFYSTPPEAKKVLVILSDFIQEDAEIDFRKDGRLADSTAAEKFAVKLLKLRSIDLQGTRVYLGLLRSSEYASMGKSRKAALAGFWIQYFKLCDMHVKFVNDGPGLLQTMLLE